MKTALFLAFTFLFFGSSTPAPVLDISGQELRTGLDYFVLPVIRGRGGGLTLESADNETLCPLFVAQEQLEVSSGLPLYFSPVNGVIRESTDLNVLFNASSICVQTTLWALTYDESLQKYVVATGGVEGNPGPETLNNWFKIEKFDDDYKLVFCPTVCDFCRPVCGELGVIIVNGIRRLALTDDPLKVMFMRV
ncbi:ARABIDOPSIS THALIANA KUNITZ TRYPSIN INHIBITOR 5 [Hibiscus trionum]|uniref:ARABIDOPSIS THALIANA KUNITZ TRYPSIN INHIBITOR 5 n=1 Tax=Hibiscus trionum TaxID=183268 RepID=A0A9W7GWP5_HIBTR|nr:ARABIDOPSIS THALIANA KUNITZ TRYPSIN INHIBITOR 5 [Hibiscus trionum]